jgi:hypothetical protein
MTRNEHIVIRKASAADDNSLDVLSVIDGGAQRLRGQILVAEAGGRIRAAVDASGAAISDPFWPSAGLVSLLRVQAGAVDRRPIRFPRFPVRRPALA